MKINRRWFFILVILLLSVLVACTRSASQPSTEPVEESGVSEDTSGTQEPMGVLEEMATQTAAAQEAGAKEAEGAPSEGEAAAEEGAAEEVPAEEVPAEAGTEGEAAPVEEAAEAEAGTEEGGGQEEPAAVPATFEVPSTYVVQKGDHLYCLARRFDINVAALLNANGLSNDSNVYPGTKLTIPKDAGGFGGNRALRDHPADYTVVAGDTINSIACYYGDVYPEAIEAANNLTGNYTLTPGQLLDIP